MYNGEVIKDNVLCSCGYYNDINKLKIYGGKCCKCKKIIDKQAHFRTNMLIKLHKTKELKKRGLNF